MFFKIKKHLPHSYQEFVMAVELNYHVAKKWHRGTFVLLQFLLGSNTGSHQMNLPKC